MRLPLCMQRPCVSTAFAYIGAVSHTPRTYGKQKKIRIFLDFSCFATVAFQWFAKYRKSLGNWIRTEMLKLQFCQNVEIYDNLVFCYFGTCPCGLRDAQLMALYAQLFFFKLAVFSVRLAASGWLPVAGDQWLAASGWRPVAGGECLTACGWWPVLGCEWLAANG